MFHTDRERFEAHQTPEGQTDTHTHTAYLGELTDDGEDRYLCPGKN